MEILRNLKRQHQDLLALSRELSSLVESGNLRDKGGEIKKSISVLNGKLKIHLSMEDEFMYPELFEHKDEKIRKLSKVYSKEMGGIFASFSAYIEKWSDDGTFVEEYEEFRKETETILSELSLRIEKEEKTLFEMID